MTTKKKTTTKKTATKKAPARAAKKGVASAKPNERKGPVKRAPRANHTAGMYLIWPWDRFYIYDMREQELEQTTLVYAQDFVEGSAAEDFVVSDPNAWSVTSSGDGGWLELVKVEGDTAYIELGGGCQGCGMADVTLKQGVEKTIRQSIPEIGAIMDTTDHASGRNPYYSPSK